MLTRITGLIGWLGFAAVLVAVGIRFGYPAKDQYATYAAYTGLVCLLIYILGQWRDVAKRTENQSNPCPNRGRLAYGRKNGD